MNDTFNILINCKKGDNKNIKKVNGLKELFLIRFR